MNTMTGPCPESAEASLRRRITEELPPEVFARRPLRALGMVPLLASVVCGAVAILYWDLAWYWALLVAVGMGHSYAMMGLLAHEILHGATVRTPWLQNLLGYVGFGGVAISPHLWRVWHNHLHHGNTNVGDRDPDGFGTLRRYRRRPSTRRVVRCAPGSGRWYSYLFFFYWFTVHSHVVLWIQSRYMRGIRGLNLMRAKCDAVLLAALWVAFGVWLGWRNSVFIILVPMAVGNAIVMSYIATNHFLRPLAKTQDPLDNSMSVRTLSLLDRLHFHFSHHVEHHYFPRMSGGQLPQVRAWLQEHAAERYVCPPHWKAIQQLYRTPRVYSDANTLCDADNPERTVAIADVTRALTGAVL